MERFPFTFYQQAFWDTLDHLSKSIMNLSCIMFFGRKLDNGLLQAAINRVILENNGLRIRFVQADDGVRQYVADFRTSDFGICEVRGRRDDSFFDDWLAREDEQAMPLFDSDLFLFKIIEMDDASACLVKINHLICDGWSLNLVKRQIEEAYDALSGGTSAPSVPRPSYLRHIRSQLDFIRCGGLQKDIEYWMYKFRPPITATGFKGKPASGAERVRSGCVVCVVPETLTVKLERFCSDRQCSILVFYSSLMGLCLARANAGNDVLIGTHFHNRRTAEEQRTIGYFSVMLPLRIQIDPDAGFSKLLNQVAGELKSGIRHNHFSRQVLNALKEEAVKRGFIDVRHAAGEDGAAHAAGEFHGLDTVVSFENYLRQEEFRYSRKAEDLFQLSVRISRDEATLVFELFHRLESFNRDEIGVIFQSLMHLTAVILENPDRSLSQLMSELVELPLVQ